MRFLGFFFLSVITAIFFITGCATDSSSTIQLNLEGSFSETSLMQRVFELKTNRKTLYAGTSKGLFRAKIESDIANWTPLFQQKSILDFVVWNQQEYLIGTPISTSQEVSIFFTQDGGDRWQPYQNGFGTEDDNNHLFVVEKHPENPEVLFARGDFNVAMSPDSGKSWQNLVGSWDGFGEGLFLTIAPSDSQIIWVGGTATFSPHLSKTTNGGSTWQNITVIENVETTVYDLAIHPSNSDVVLAGLDGIVKPARLIRQSTDGGQNWDTVFVKAGIRTFTHSARTPETVYASGRNQAGTLFFAASGDFGDSWETVEWENSPAGVQVNDMISVMENGREVLYFGTNKGVYSYTFEN